MARSRDYWPGVVVGMQKQVDWLMADVVSRKPPMVRFSPKTWQPAVDVYDTDAEMVVLVELAGVKEDEVEVTVQNDVLWVRGERRDVSRGIKRTYSQMEIMWGPFERSVALPSNVDVDQIRAFYGAGFLEVVIPKLVGRKPRRVDIRVS